MRGMIPQNEFENLKRDSENLKQNKAEVYKAVVNLGVDDWVDNAQTFDSDIVEEEDLIEVIPFANDAGSVTAFNAAGIVAVCYDGEIIVHCTTEDVPEVGVQVVFILHKKVQSFTPVLHVEGN